MKLIAPKNFFTSVLAEAINKNELELFFVEASLIGKELEYNTSAIGLIPSLDLINHRNLFVSSKYAVSFDGMLSNSFFYFHENERRFEEITLRGDVSLNDVILTKILFSERFSSQAEITLDTGNAPTKGKDYLVVGDENYSVWDFKNGISFSDQIAEMLDFPYVNYIFASPDKEALNNFNNLIGNVDQTIEEKIDDIIKHINLNEEAKLFLKENIDSIYYEMTSNETEGLNELIKLMFYHGNIEDMFDIKFV
ncbi:MAG: hypothetical protein M1391_09045 [Bacteroidetes bacterium]|nr:hypothetical protein [Bacteroidota bacterium]